MQTDQDPQAERGECLTGDEPPQAAGLSCEPGPLGPPDGSGPQAGRKAITRACPQEIPSLTPFSVA